MFGGSMPLDTRRRLWSRAPHRASQGRSPLAQRPVGLHPIPRGLAPAYIRASGCMPAKTQGSYMPIVSVVLTLIVVGVILWLINTYIPMQSTIKSIINAVVVIAVVLWLLYGFGIISHSGDIHMPVVK